MNKFKDFGIKPTLQSLVGDKIKIERLLNREISVEDYRLEDSKYGTGGTKCLYMQIVYDKEKRVVFSGSKVLIELIEQIPKTKFPFTTIIVKENDRFEFT
jgi:hypothetical protein